MSRSSVGTGGKSRCMTEQPDLPLWGDGRKPLALRYAEWRETVDGREVAELVGRAALDQAANGAKRISINLLFEQFRQARHAKIDNSFRACLAAELRDRYPWLKALIHVKAHPKAA